MDAQNDLGFSDGFDFFFCHVKLYSVKESYRLNAHTEAFAEVLVANFSGECKLQ